MPSGARGSFAAAVLVLSLFAGGCLSEDDPTSFPELPRGRPTRSEGLVIALVGTLSGADAWRGEDAFEGADLAVHELNQDRGAGDLPFELVALDDRGDPAEATRRVAEITQLDRVVGVVYAGPPAGLPPAEEALALAGIPAIIVHGDLYGSQELTPHLFQASPSYLWGARRLVRYFLDDRGYRTVGLVAENDSQGDGAVAAVRTAMEARNRRPAVARYGPGRPPLEDLLERLERRRTEAIIVQGNAATFSSVVDALDDMGAAYRTTSRARLASARPPVRRQRNRVGAWRPQIGAFAPVISTALNAAPSPGTVAADSYARGVHFLPVPNFRDFEDAFREWWDAGPLGWEQRAYDATRALGWAANAAEPGEDLAVALEGLADARFGGADIALATDDHMLIDQSAVGLWTISRPDLRIAGAARRPDSLPWVPLARGFSIDGRTTDIAPADWIYLFRRPPSPSSTPPPARRMRFAVSTPRNDPVH